MGELRAAWSRAKAFFVGSELTPQEIVALVSKARRIRLAREQELRWDRIVEIEQN